MTSYLETLLMRALAILLIATVAAPAAAEILTLRNDVGDVSQIDIDNRLFRWVRTANVLEGYGTRSEEVEQFGEIREPGVVREGEGLFYTEYTTWDGSGRWRASMPFVMSSDWARLTSSLSAGWEPHQVSPEVLHVPVESYVVRQTRRESFPPDPEDGLIARNIISDVTEGVWSIRTVNDWQTKSPSLITWLETGDGVTWTIGARQYWGEGPETVDWLNSRFSPVPEPSTVVLTVVALALVGRWRRRSGG